MQVHWEVEKLRGKVSAAALAALSSAAVMAARLQAYIGKELRLPQLKVLTGRASSSLCSRVIVRVALLTSACLLQRCGQPVGTEG